MEQSVTTLEDLLPLVRDAETCREFGAIVIAHVPKHLKSRLALAARDALGRDWTESTLRDVLKPGLHAPAYAEAKRIRQAEVRSTPEGRERHRAANRVACSALYAKARATPEGRALINAAGRAQYAKTTSTPEGRAKVNAAGKDRKRANPLSKMIGHCRYSSKMRGHGPVDEAHLRYLWERALGGETPWHGLLDFKAFGVADDTGTAGSPWAPSFDRLDNRLGYVEGNVALVPNLWNRTCNRYDRRLVLDLVTRASLLRIERRQDRATVEVLGMARLHRLRLESYLSGSNGNVFHCHPTLVPHRAEMMRMTLSALYSAGGGVCAVTGLAFVPEPGHPCMPSWDLVDHRLGSQHRYAGSGRARQRVDTEGGRETPADMRLVCAFFNFGRCTFDDADWWRMADRVRELVEAGVPT
jgi:hypothetical protein